MGDVSIMRASSEIKVWIGFDSHDLCSSLVTTFGCCFVLFQELLIQFFRDGHRTKLSQWSFWEGDVGFSWSRFQWKVTKPVKTAWSLSLRICLKYWLMTTQITPPK